MKLVDEEARVKMEKRLLETVQKAATRPGEVAQLCTLQRVYVL